MLQEPVKDRLELTDGKPFRAAAGEWIFAGYTAIYFGIIRLAAGAGDLADMVEEDISPEMRNLIFIVMSVIMAGFIILNGIRCEKRENVAWSRKLWLITSVIAAIAAFRYIFWYLI